jgi:hypothetical protein
VPSLSLRLTMPLLNRADGKSINFIHIPRTGGRFVVELFRSNGFDFTFPEDHRLHWSKTVDGHEVMHFHAELMTRYLNLVGIRSFTIVRNPISRFISAAPAMLDLLHAPLTEISPEELEKSLSAALAFAPNWFRPQHEFILPGTLIWRYEDGLDEKFFDWLRRVVGVSLSLNHNIALGSHPHDRSHKPYLPERLIPTLKKFYARDFELLNSRHSYI